MWVTEIYIYLYTLYTYTPSNVCALEYNNNNNKLYMSTNNILLIFHFERKTRKIKSKHYWIT